MFVEDDSFFDVFCNDGVFILHLQVVFLRVSLTKSQTVKSTQQLNM